MEQDVLSQIQITDDAIAIIALRNLINSDDADMIRIVQDGQTDTTLKSLLDSNSFTRVMTIARNTMSVKVTLNIDKLHATLKKINLVDTEQNHFEWAIAKGASNRLLTQLFPVLADPNEVGKLRKILTPENTGSIRKPTIKSREVREQIHLKWQVLNQGLNMTLFEKLRALHGHFDGEYELNMLYIVLKEYGDIE